MRKTIVEQTLFGIQLPESLEHFLFDTNPWWQDKPMRPLPPFRRWLFENTLQRLQITVLRGPRQVGKTTLQEHIIDYLLHEEGICPQRIFRVQFDEISSLKGLSDDPSVGKDSRKFASVTIHYVPVGYKRLFLLPQIALAAHHISATWPGI
jgi:hypothetical protein